MAAEEELADETVHEGYGNNEDAFGLDIDQDALQMYEEDRLTMEPIVNPNYTGVFEEHEDSIFCMDLSPSGEFAITGAGNEHACVWNLNNQELITVLKGHTDSVIWAGFSCKEEYCATASMDGTVRVYLMEDFSLKHILEGPSEEIEFACWHPRGNVILAGCRDCTIWMWDAKKGRCMQVFAGHAGAITSGGFTYDGKVAYTGCEDGSVKLWNPKDGSTKCTFEVTKLSHFHESTVTCMTHHPNKKVIASGSVDSSIFLMHSKKGKVVARLSGHQGNIECLAFAPTVTFLASGDLSGQLIIWDTRSNTKRNVVQFKSGVLCLIFTEELFIYAGFVDGTIVRIGGRNGQIQCTYRGHMGPVHALKLTKNNKILVSCSDDEKCFIWDAMLVEEEEEIENEEEKTETEIIKKDEEEKIKIIKEEENGMWTSANNEK